MKSTSAIVIGFTAICWSALCQAAPNSRQPIQPVYTKQLQFRIPYHYDAAEMRKLRAREIHLYVSLDRGRRWQHVQSVRPETGRFDFRASGDGEYWFSVQTLDAFNQLHPSGNAIEAGLKVIVDTKPPVLRVALTVLAPGRVQLAWHATDENLDSSTLRLEYLQAGAQDWQPVSVVPQPNGTTSWTVPQGGVVAVRGTISDRASNVGRAQHRQNIKPARQAAPDQAVPDFNQPIAAISEWPTRSIDPNPRFPDVIPGGTLSTPDGNRPDIVAAPSSLGGPNVSTSRPQMQNQFVADAFENRPDVFQRRYPNPNVPLPRQRPSGRYRVVNARRFQIGYKIDDVGPSGISSVDLYVSQDHGKKWWKYGQDGDRQSPFEVSVPKDGIYGFVLRVQSGAGLSDGPPRPGEQPSIIVVVDQTPPVVQLMPVQQGQGAALNELLIRWTVSDDNPNEKPIALYYSANPNGSWEPISGWLADGGSYRWTVGPEVPKRLYVRLAARDEAGNVSHVVTPKPIVIDLSKPSARIVDVESVGQPR